MAAEPATARDGRPGRDGRFWSARTVAWYQRAMERSDYPARVLGAIEPLLADTGSVLDVGAGSGALALPLAGWVPRVTALEPAPAMAAALRAEARARGLRHLTVVEAAWGDVALPPHDLVLCSHVGELTRPGAPFLQDAARWARRWVVVVRDGEPESDKLFFRELYPALLGRPYGRGSSWTGTLDDLADLGIRAGVLPIEYRADQPFSDLDEACDFYEAYLGVSGGAARGFLREFLARRLVPEARGLVAPYSKRAVVLWWPGAAPAGTPRRWRT
jgi:SAM-dependent methyltransferase